MKKSARTLMLAVLSSVLETSLREDPTAFTVKARTPDLVLYFNQRFSVYIDEE